MSARTSLRHWLHERAHPGRGRLLDPLAWGWALRNTAIHLARPAPRFAFLVHPRSIEDFARVRYASLLSKLSGGREAFEALVCSLPPFIAGGIRIGSSNVGGEVVGILRMPKDMSGPGAKRAILGGVDLALDRGVSVVGLGALTAPATGGGLTLVPHLPEGITLTNGNAYTAVVVRENVVEASRFLGRDQGARVAVVGCTGSVGVPASRLLADAGFALTLIGKSVDRVRHALPELASTAECRDSPAHVKGCDVVVLLTNEPSACPPDEALASAVVIDCAQPPNLSPPEVGRLRRAGITVVEGGVVRITDYSCGYDFGLAGPGEAFACLAETYLFAREGIREHSVGRPTVALARRLEEAAVRYGVRPRPLNLRGGDGTRRP